MDIGSMVITGYSKPYVAKYSATGTTVTLSNPVRLARGVKVDVQPSSSDATGWYADNVQSESAPGKFTGGTASFECDEPSAEVLKLIEGTPEEDEITVGGKKVKVTHYNSEQSIPYVAVGYIIRYQEAGVEYFKPFVLRKAQFTTPNDSAETQGENITFQTKTLSANLFYDDSAKPCWKDSAERQTTEAEAEAVLKVMLGGDAA